MKRNILLILAIVISLITFVSPSYAADAVAAVAPEANSWVVIITTVLGLVLAWAGKLLREKWKVSTQREALDATKSLWEQRNFIIDNRIIPFALNTAEDWLGVHMGILLQDAIDGGGFQWKDHWGDLKIYTKQRVINKFAAENVDVVELIGVDELDDLIDRLLFKLIGKLPDNVKAFIPNELVDKVTDMGTQWAVDFAKERSAKLLK